MNKFYLIVLLLIFYLGAMAQNKIDLELQKKQTNQDINFTNDLILTTQKHKKNSLNKVVLLNSKITSREALIETIEEELKFIDNQILIHQEIIINLEKDLVKYKKEYERMIYYSFINNDEYDKFMFVLASKSFNEAFQRLRYLKQYAKNRKLQIDKITITKQNISEKIVELEIIKADKQNLFLDKKLENQRLISEKQEYSLLLKNLTSKEKELRKKLKKQQEMAANLQREIQRIIQEEARKAAELLKKTGKNFFQLTPDEMKLAAIFEQNKSALPWPTERGIVTRKFGEQPHPVLKGIIVRNDGIDITTSINSTVRAVYKGQVSSVFAIPGANKTVIIRHGSYLTVYSNLKDVVVKKGDIVDTKEIIGTVFTNKDEEDKTVLQFQIWHEDKKLDPSNWLAKYKNG